MIKPFFFFNIILINPVLEHVRWFLCSEIIPFDWLVLISHPALQLTKLHQLAMQHPPFTPLGQTTPGFPGTYPWPPGDVLLLNSFVSRGHYIILIINVVNDQWSLCSDALIFVLPSLASVTVPFIFIKTCFVCYIYLIETAPFVPLAKNPGFIFFSPCKVILDHTACTSGFWAKHLCVCLVKYWVW